MSDIYGSSGVETLPSGAGKDTFGAGGGPGMFSGGDFFGNNPMLLGGLAGAAGLGMAAFGGGGKDLPFQSGVQGTIGGLGNVAGIAQGGYDELMGRGRTLMDPLTSGKLPAGAEQSVANMVKGQETSTKGRYASLGLSGSTMEGDALVNVQNQATAQRFQIAQQMAMIGSQAVSQAIQELGISERAFGDQGKLYGDLMKAQMQQDKDSSAAIANFAKAIGGAIAFL